MTHLTLRQTASADTTVVAAILNTQMPLALHQATPTHPELVDRHQTITQISRDQHLPVQYLGQGLVPDRPTYIQSPTADFAMFDITDDPLAQSEYKLPAPNHAIRDLHRIRDQGLEFDLVKIVHEAPPGTIGRYGYIPPEMFIPDPSLVAQQRAQQMGNFGQTLMRLATAPLLLIGGTVVIAAALPLAAGALAGVDPMILGLVTTSQPTTYGQTWGAWYYLTHWYY